MRRNGEHGLSHLPHTGLVEVNKVLRCQQHGGVALTDTLEAVADVLHRREIPQPEVELVQCRHRVTLAQKHVGHVRENVEQNRRFHIRCQRIQTTDAKHEKAAGANIGVPVEEQRVGTHAHGVNTEQHLLQKLFGVKRGMASIVVIVLPLDQRIQIGQDRKTLGRETGNVRIAGDVPLSIQPGQQNLDGVHMGVGEILVRTKEVLEPGDVLSQNGGLLKSTRRVLIRRFEYAAPCVPAFRFQYVDAVLSGHQINEVSAEGSTEILLLMLCIQRNHGFAGFEEVYNQVLHEVGLALAGVAEDQDTARGLVRVALVEVHEDVGAVVILADVKAVAVRLATVVEGIEIGHRRGGEHPLKL